MVIEEKLGVFFPEYYTHFIITKYFSDYCVFTDKAMHLWLEKFIPKKNLIEYDATSVKYESRFELLDDHVKASNIGVTSSWLTSADDRQWAEKRGIQLICSPIRLVEELDNKLRFDEFLESNGISKPKRIGSISRLPDNERLVIQMPLSWGSEGTFFVNNVKEANLLISQGILDKKDGYLIREFIEGPVYGITLFVSNDKIIMSPLRTQHYLDKQSGGKRLFAGIQWVDSGSLPRRLSDKVNDIFSRLGRILHKRKYLGYANFDFIYDGKEIYVIECNPRTSLANSHIFSDKDIMHGFDTLAIFIDGIINQKDAEVTYSKNPEIYGLKRSVTTQGAAILIPNGKKTVIDSNGVYRFNRSGFDLIDPDTRNFSKDKDILLYTGWFYTNPGIDEDIAQITLNVPIFTSDGLNDLGRRLFKDG